MGERNNIQKKTYAKPTISELKKPKTLARLPKLVPETFRGGNESEPGPVITTSTNPWTIGETKLFPISFSKWPKPKDVFSDSSAFSSVFQNVLIHRIDRPKFTQSLSNLAGLNLQIARSFHLTFGWEPPKEFAMWLEAEAALHGANCPLFRPGGWTLALQLGPVENGTLEKRSLFPWTKGESILAIPLGLFTGLFFLGNDPSGETLLASSLPGVPNVEIHNTDQAISYLGATRSNSLTELLLSIKLSEIADENSVETLAIERLLKHMSKHRKRKESFARQTLFARTRWLVSLLDKGDLPESFEQMLMDAPAWDDWQEEREWIGSYPFLANYWHMAHWFFGNEGACRQAISIARKAKGSVTARLADIVGRLLDGARLDLGALSADKIDQIRRKIRGVVEPRMLSPLAKAALDRKAKLMPTKKKDKNAEQIESKKDLPIARLLEKLKAEINKTKQLHNLSPSHAGYIQPTSNGAIELATLIERSGQKDAEQLAQAVIDLSPEPMDLGVCWGHAIKAAGDLGLKSFAPAAMRYCKNMLENQQWDPHTDEAFCYSFAESARTAAMLNPEKANPYLWSLLQSIKNEAPPRFVAIGALLLSGLLLLRPSDEKILALLNLALNNRAQERIAYLYGALRAIQTVCNAGKTIDIPATKITMHICGFDYESNTSIHICEAAESAMASILRPSGKNALTSKLQKDSSLEATSEWLMEQLRYSSFLHHPLHQSHHWDGLIRLVDYGESCTDELWKLTKLKHLHKDWMGPIISMARRAAPLSTLLELLRKSDLESMKKLLLSPAPPLIGWLDFIAAWVSLDASPTSLAAVSSACTWRLKNKPSLTEFEDMLNLRLPFVLASFGKRASTPFERLLQESTEGFNHAILKKAMQTMDEWEDGVKPSLSGEQLLAGATLEYVSYFRSLYSRLELTHEQGQDPTVRIGLSESHKLLDDGVYPVEYSQSISFDDLDGIQIFANNFARVATILGYDLVD